MLCQFQVYDKMTQLYMCVYMYIYAQIHMSILPSDSFPTQIIRVLSRVPCAVQQVLVDYRLYIVMCFMYTIVYMSTPNSNDRQHLDLYVESKKLIQMNLFIKQKQTHRLQKQIYDCKRGRVWGGRDTLGVCMEHLNPYHPQGHSFFTQSTPTNLVHSGLRSHLVHTFIIA